MLLFWICAAILTAGVVFALTRSLVPRSGTQPQSAAASAETSDLDVYRDQLREIEADKERGLIAGVEAEAARVEVARRLLQRSAEIEAAARQSSPAVTPRQQQRLFVAVAAAVPALALLVYLNLGAPHLPGQPHAQRVAQAERGAGEIEEMITRVEARLRENPGEGQGWEVLAPVYLRLDRFAEAADAFQHAIELLGPNPRRLGGFAEATVLANNGVVTERARRAYEKILELEPGRPEARFGLALAKEQDGELAEAEAAFRALLADTPADAAWREFIVARLDVIADRRGMPKAPRPDASAAAGRAHGDDHADGGRPRGQAGVGRA